MNNLFNKELIAKAKTAKSVEELIELAKAENIVLPQGEAKNIFAQLNPASGALSDEELEKVVGGCNTDAIYDFFQENKAENAWYSDH